MANLYPPVDIAFKVFLKKSLDNNRGFHEIMKDIFIYMNAIGYQRTPYQMKFEGFKRARVSSLNSIEEVCEDFNNVNELSYPPEKCVKSVGRCNLERESIFYCTPDSGVAIFEVRPQIGQFVALATFIPKYENFFNLLLPVIGVREIVEVYEKHDKNNQLLTMLKDDILYKGDPLITNFDEISAFDKGISTWFTQPVNEDNKHIYKLTTAVYRGFINYVKYDEENISGIIYPSVAANLTGYNIALETNLVDNQLTIVNPTVIYHVENIISGTYYLRPMKQIYSINNDGIITWTVSDEIDNVWELNTSDPTIMISRF